MFLLGVLLGIGLLYALSCLCSAPAPAAAAAGKMGVYARHSTPEAPRPASVRRGRFERPEYRAVRRLTAQTTPIRPLQHTPEVCRSGQIEPSRPVVAMGQQAGR